MVLGALMYDRRKGEHRGRILRVDLPTLGLAKRWRLEPSPELPDIGGLDGLTVDTFPAAGVHLTFWGTKANSFCRHRNPLLDGRVCRLEDCAGDELHCMHLGVFADYSAAAVWQLIEANAWNVRERLENTR